MGAGADEAVAELAAAVMEQTGHYVLEHSASTLITDLKGVIECEGAASMTLELFSVSERVLGAPLFADIRLKVIQETVSKCSAELEVRGVSTENLQMLRCCFALCAVRKQGLIPRMLAALRGLAGHAELTGVAMQIDAMVEMVNGQVCEEAADTVIDSLSHVGVDRAPNPLSAAATSTSIDVGDTNESDEANAGVDTGRAMILGQFHEAMPSAGVEACIADPTSTSSDTEATKDEANADTDKIITQLFQRYDLDNSGTIDTFEELDQLCCNLIYKLKIMPEEPIGSIIKQVKEQETRINWDRAQFTTWFHGKILAGQ